MPALGLTSASQRETNTATDYYRAQLLETKDVVNVCYIFKCIYLKYAKKILVVVVVLLFYIHGKHLRSCRDGQLT